MAKATTGFNSRRTVSVDSFSLGTGSGDSVCLTLLSRNPQGSRRSYRRFQIELNPEEFKSLYEMMGRRIGGKDLLQTAVQSLFLGFGLAVGNKYLPTPKSECAIVKTDKGGQP